MRPATTFLRPGAIVFVRNEKLLQVGLICNADQVFGADFPPMESPAINFELARATRRSFRFDANMVDAWRGQAEVSGIKSIKLTLHSVHVYELTDRDVVARAAALDESCRAALHLHRKQGVQITMVSSALQADATYSIQWESAQDLDAQAKVAQLEQLAASLRLENASSKTNAIEAKGLIWGIRDDAYLAHLLLPKEIDGVDRRASRYIAADAEPTLQLGFDDVRRPSLPALLFPSGAMRDAQRHKGAKQSEHDAQDARLPNSTQKLIEEQTGQEVPTEQENQQAAQDQAVCPDVATDDDLAAAPAVEGTSAAVLEPSPVPTEEDVKPCRGMQRTTKQKKDLGGRRHSMP